MTDSTEATPEVTTEATESKVEMLKTKAVQPDKTYKHFEAPLALPTTREAFVSLVTDANAALQEFIQECASLGVMGKARNHLVSGRLAQGVAITYQTTLAAQMDAAANRGNSGGLTVYREVQAAVIAYAASTGLSAKGCGILKKLISDSTLLMYATAKHRTRVQELVNAYVATATVEDLEAYETYLDRILVACEGVPAGSEEEDDF